MILFLAICDRTFKRRCRYEANTYHRPAPDAAGAKHDTEHASDPVQSQSTSEQQPLLSKTRAKMKFFSKSLSQQVPLEVEEEEGPETDVLEIWFAGCHSGKAFVHCYIVLIRAP